MPLCHSSASVPLTPPERVGPFTTPTWIQLEMVRGDPVIFSDPMLCVMRRGPTFVAFLAWINFDSLSCEAKDSRTCDTHGHGGGKESLLQSFLWIVPSSLGRRHLCGRGES